MKNLALGIMFLTLVLACPTMSMAASGAIEEIKGEVEIWLAGASAWVKVVGPMAVEKGDKIKTGENGFAQMSFANGTTVYLRPKTDFAIDDVIYKGNTLDSVQATLNLGELMSRVRKGGGEEKFRVKTPSAIAGVRGTEFFLKVYQANKAKATHSLWMRPAYADISDFVTEILVETGEVLFGNLDLSMMNLVHDGQWGIVHEDGVVDLPVDVAEDVRDGWHEGFRDIAPEPQGEPSPPDVKEDVHFMEKEMGEMDPDKPERDDFVKDLDPLKEGLSGPGPEGDGSLFEGDRKPPHNEGDHGY